MVNIDIYVGDLADWQVRLLGGAIEQVQDLLRNVMRGGRCSLGLVVELARHTLNGPYDVTAIYQELKCLEQGELSVTGTKAATQFKHEPLRGLWHKHHNQAAFMARNIESEMDRRKTLQTWLQRHAGAILTHEMIKDFIQQVVVTNFDQRSAESRLTGEWIVYERIEQTNYYLCLASHKENDVEIRARVDVYRQIDKQVVGQVTSNVN